MNRRSVFAIGVAAGLTLILAGSAFAGSMPGPGSGTISPWVSD